MKDCIGAAILLIAVMVVIYFPTVLRILAGGCQ